MKKRLTAILGAVLVALALTGCTLPWQKEDETDQEEEREEVTVSVIVDEKNGDVEKCEDVTVEKGKSAYDVIVEAEGKCSNVDFEMEDSGDEEMGYLVTAINGYEPDEAESEFWEFVVNGTSSMAGISQYDVEDGDELEFRVGSF